MEDKNKNAHPFDLETVLKQEIIELFFFLTKTSGLYFKQNLLLANCFL